MNITQMAPKLFHKMWNRFESMDELQTFTKQSRQNLQTKRKACEYGGLSGFKDFHAKNPESGGMGFEEFRDTWNKCRSIFQLEKILWCPQWVLENKRKKAELNGVTGFKELATDGVKPPKTEHLPGTWEKIQVMAWRIENGYDTFCDEDARGDLA